MKLNENITDFITDFKSVDPLNKDIKPVHINDEITFIQRLEIWQKLCVTKDSCQDMCLFSLGHEHMK